MTGTLNNEHRLIKLMGLYLPRSKYLLPLMNVCYFLIMYLLYMCTSVFFVCEVFYCV